MPKQDPQGSGNYYMYIFYVPQDKADVGDVNLISSVKQSLRNNFDNGVRRLVEEQEARFARLADQMALLNIAMASADYPPVTANLFAASGVLQLDGSITTYFNIDFSSHTKFLMFTDIESDGQEFDGLLPYTGERYTQFNAGAVEPTLVAETATKITFADLLERDPEVRYVRKVEVSYATAGSDRPAVFIPTVKVTRALPQIVINVPVSTSESIATSDVDNVRLLHAYQYLSEFGINLSGLLVDPSV